ncbi:MAG TPA: hypothetical protein VIP05_18105, partial [Burkholderiaceae bacterium]
AGQWVQTSSFRTVEVQICTVYPLGVPPDTTDIRAAQNQRLHRRPPPELDNPIGDRGAFTGDSDKIVLPLTQQKIHAIQIA